LINWVAEHRETVIILLAASAVLLPLFTGYLLGHVPKQIFVTWALPLAAGTIFLAIGIRFFESTENRWIRLSLNGIFGLLWIVAGLKTAFVKSTDSSGVPAAAVKTARAFGLMFLLFGLIWIAISVYQTL